MPSDAPALRTRALAPTHGVEILDIDLARPLDDATFAAIRAAWLTHKVLLFRGQTLEESDLVRFGRRFGELEIHVRTDTASREHPEVLLVTNKKENGKAIGVLGDAEAPWHVDQIYMKQPTHGTMLYAVSIPPEGGNTYVCDMARAYETLPADLRSRIEGRRAINSAAYFNRRHNGGMTQAQLDRVPDVSHPLVRTHPTLPGRKSLFMSPGHTMRVEGLDERASEELLQALERHATRADLVYEHVWRVGDVLMWDNTQTMHRRDPFDPAALRLLKRISFMYPQDLRTPF